jgi:hypothetical protein
MSNVGSLFNAGALTMHSHFVFYHPHRLFWGVVLLGLRGCHGIREGVRSGNVSLRNSYTVRVK